MKFLFNFDCFLHLVSLGYNLESRAPGAEQARGQSAMDRQNMIITLLGGGKKKI